MLLNVARFELKYQLRNPVFWVSLFLFFLLGFGVTASENVSIGTPGTVNENSPFAIASMMALTSLFYLFVITSFVASAGTLIRSRTLPLICTGSSISSSRAADSSTWGHIC